MRFLGSVINRPGLSGAIATAAIVLLIAPVIGLLGVVAADRVPDRAILDELVDAVDRRHLTDANYGQAISGHQIDFLTDCIGITIGLDDGRAGWTSAIRSPTLGNCEEAVPLIESYAATGESPVNWEYFRYWHGASLVLRPGIALVGLGGLRIVTLVAMTVVVIGLGRSLGRAYGPAVAILTAAPLVLTTDLLELARSLPHGWAAITALATAWGAHAIVRRRPTTNHVVLVSVAGGAAYVFVDLLTMVPGAWALLVFVVALAGTSVWSGAALAGRTSVAAGGWIVGWAVMWLWKWLLAALVYGTQTVIDTVRFTAENRLTGENDTIDASFLVSTRAVLDAWRSQPLTAVVLAAAAIGVVAVLLRRRRGGEPLTRPVDRLVLMAPAALPFLWFEILRNHTQSHAWFAYRSLAISAGIVAAAAVVRLASVERAAAANAAGGRRDDSTIADDAVAVSDGPS